MAAQLVSPGVDVQIIEESFYTSAGAGTVPLIIMATAANKPSPSGTGTAPYTLPSQAGKLFLATSQRELVQNFGNPTFKTVQGTPVHGHELNEYGLHAAYSFLGISNRCYVLRADIDLNQLEASDSAPRGAPVAGTYWLDLTSNETRWGVFQSNGNPVAGSAWEVQPVKVLLGGGVVEQDGRYVPNPSYGSDGDFAVVAYTSDNLFYEKIGGAWHALGSAGWKAARPTTVRGVVNTGMIEVGQFAINGVTIDFADGGDQGTLTTLTAFDVMNKINAMLITDVVAEISNNALTIKQTAGGNLTIANVNGTMLTALGLPSGTHKGVRVTRTNTAAYPAASVAGDVWIKGNSANQGASWKVKRYNGSTGQWMVMTAPLFPFNALLGDGNPSKDAAALSQLGVPAVGEVYVGYDVATGAQMLRRWSGTRWEDLVYEASFEEPSTEPEDGTMWFNADFQVDIMYGDGDAWMGYRRKYPNTDPAGVLLAGSAPITQSDGTPLVDHDLWIDTSDLENYPLLHRYDATARRWKRIDLTDQTTPFGIVFADARANSGRPFGGMPNAGAYTYGSRLIADLLISDYVEPDAPDPRAYPDGMLLFNTRYSTYNVKVWRPNHFKDGHYDENTDYTRHPYHVGNPAYEFAPLGSAGRWVTASGNRHDGAPLMGRKAQRAMIVRAMSEAVQLNDDLRSELVFFNLMAAPGYPELIDELVTLNVDQKETAFIVADTPARLKPLATDIQNWAGNAKGAPSNGEEGLTSSNIYCAVYYPWGLGSNIDGTEVMIPPSTIALRTMAYNDQVAYPWFAPAGFQRGLVTNATTVGYLTDEGEFQPVLLNPGQRDVLYLNKINPIAFIPGRGLVMYGQKTLSALESALDRINVARLANYLKYNLDNVMKPFLFEQNDQQTRDAAKLTVERVLTNLVGLRAIEDYAVVCNIENNTPERIDRNELWLDALIRPLKAVEFIYLPVRIRNTGDDLNL